MGSIAYQWLPSSRAPAAQKFKPVIVEIKERDYVFFETCEMGKLSMDEYLKQVIFYENQDFSPDESKTFIYAQSQPFAKNTAVFKRLKSTRD